MTETPFTNRDHLACMNAFKKHRDDWKAVATMVKGKTDEDCQDYIEEFLYKFKGQSQSLVDYL